MVKSEILKARLYFLKLFFATSGKTEQELKDHGIISMCPGWDEGLYFGGQLVKVTGHLDTTEYLAGTGVPTNHLSDSADPIGGGLLLGYKLSLWDNFVAGPFLSVDFMRAPVNHTFANGSFLGSTANVMATAGVKAGPRFDNGLWVYGIGGVSVLNQTLNVNFIPVASSRSATVPGATVGIGGAVTPGFMQIAGAAPVSLFVEYHHTWWGDAQFNRPLASPLFNYRFRRQDDVVKLGFSMTLDTWGRPIEWVREARR